MSFKNWSDVNAVETAKPYFAQLKASIDKEYTEHTCYPPYDQIFNAIMTTPYHKVKCVILGQDPYPSPNQAMGLSFSVNKGVPIPRSLQNIYKELQNEFGCYIPNNGDLTPWAEQGVLLLNAILSVQAHNAASHSGLGWETYTDALLSALNERNEPIVFMLWGNFARSKKAFITNKHHLILECPHPSPFSADRGFFGCGHFKKCNEFLTNNGLQPIDWQIRNI